MLFHVIGIKEAQNKKYNIDVLIKGISEKFIREFLQHQNVVVLNIVQYNKTLLDFGNIQIDIVYKNKDNTEIMSIFSSLTDIKSTLSLFMTIGFKVQYINFIEQNKLDEQAVKDLIGVVTLEVDAIKNKQQQDVLKKQEQERTLYKDDKLERIVKIVEQASVQISNLTQTVGSNMSQSNVREIKDMEQELTKLKMGRNDDKMLELLKKIYDKIYEIENEYLELMKPQAIYPIQDSVVTDIDIILEDKKFQKSKRMKEIGAKRSIQDNYYLSFETLGIYIKLFLKDLKYRSQRLGGLAKNTFWYINLSVISMTLALSIVLWFAKVAYIIDFNLYNYVFLIKLGSFGLVLSIIQRFKKQITNSVLIYLCISIFISILLFWFLKINFAF